jgi:hypothetical protein
VWLGLSAFGASAITAIALSTVMPSGNIDLGERALRKRPIVAQLRRPTRSASLLVGAVHDPASLFAYAQEAKREGNDITLVDAWVSAATAGSSSSPCVRADDQMQVPLTHFFCLLH